MEVWITKMRGFMNWNLHWWLGDRLTTTCRLCCCITNPRVRSVRGIALNSGWSRPGFTSCVVTAGIPLELASQWNNKFDKIRESLELDSHRPLLADGSVWNITRGMQVFPALTGGGGGCILDCTQTASSDWWAQRMFTPAQQNKHFFFRT